MSPSIPVHRDMRKISNKFHKGALIMAQNWTIILELNRQMLGHVSETSVALPGS